MWSIHKEKDDKFTVRSPPNQDDLAKMPTSSKEECEVKAEATRGTQVGGAYDTQREAVRGLEALESEQRKDIKVAAAKELLGI